MEKELKTNSKDGDVEKYSLYKGEVELTFDKVKHLYLANGEKAHGVTSILGALAKPALIFWAANKAAEYIRENLEPGVAYDELQIQEFVEGAKNAHRKKSKEAADVGTLAHNWISKWIKGENPEVLTNRNAKEICEKFVKWVEDKKVEFVFSERKVYSKKLGYAGTCDFVARIDGELWVGDIKTANAFYDEQLWQTSAYRKALEEELGETYVGRVVIRCGKGQKLKDGTWKEGDFEEIETREGHEEDLIAFLGLYSAYKRKQTLNDLRYQTKLNL